MRPGKYTTGSRLAARRPGAGRFFQSSKGGSGFMLNRKTLEFKDIAILLIDVANFSITPGGTPGKRARIQSLQEVLRAAARFFISKGDPWRKWKEWPRHGTGDGYYYLFDAGGPQVALQYALSIQKELEHANQKNGPDWRTKVRMSLGYGDVELVEDQLLSDAFIETERFISYGPFKKFAGEQESCAALVITSLFHHQLVTQKSTPSEIKELKWSPIEVIDKHGHRYLGYILGPAWPKEAPATAKADDESQGPRTQPTVAVHKSVSADNGSVAVGGDVHGDISVNVPAKEK
jgi:hypothetical protein